MKIYMVRTAYDSYCVYSETAMNNINRSTEEDALNEFYTGHTFNPTDGNNAVYILNPNATELRIEGGTIFGTVLYEISSSSGTSTYEYW